MSIEENMMKNLIRTFSEFKQSQNYENEDLTPYNVFGDFAIHIQDDLSNNTISNSEIKKAIIFMNNMANSNYKYIRQLITTR